jgi:hypothetical protein
MPQPRPNLTRIHMQNLILAKFGLAMMQEYKDRLCANCAFAGLHGHHCRLLPITSEGKDGSYFSTSQLSQVGGTTNA